MTIYIDDQGKKVVAWRIPQAIDCIDEAGEYCPHEAQIVRPEEDYVVVCDHPQAEGKGGGWLKACPLKGEK